MFCAGDMPFEAVNGQAEMDNRLSDLNLSVGWEGFELAPMSTALVSSRRFGEGAYGQLFSRMLRRLRA
jgi:hypothetical protein